MSKYDYSISDIFDTLNIAIRLAGGEKNSTLFALEVAEKEAQETLIRTVRNTLTELQKGVKEGAELDIVISEFLQKTNYY